ncbi:MAG: hypothetical protein NVV63_11135 [Opitutus sp.]|nr:hypothetical protein [Opitutus sp.]
MIYLLLFLVGAIYLLGAVILSRSVAVAVIAHEDADGWHFGPAPEPVSNARSEWAEVGRN